MEINWTPRAIDSLIETMRFISYHFGMDVGRKVCLMIEKRVEMLLQNPFMGKVDQENSTDQIEFRFIVINKRSKVYYFIHEDCIHIVLVWDDRQNIISLAELLALKG